MTVCHWHDCSNEATDVIRDVTVKPKGSHTDVDVGDVEVCPMHLLIAQRLGRIVLDRERLTVTP